MPDEHRRTENYGQNNTVSRFAYHGYLIADLSRTNPHEAGGIHTERRPLTSISKTQTPRKQHRYIQMNGPPCNVNCSSNLCKFPRNAHNLLGRCNCLGCDDVRCQDAGCQGQGVSILEGRQGELPRCLT